MGFKKGIITSVRKITPEQKNKKTKFKEEKTMFKKMKNYFTNNLESIARGMAVLSGNDIRAYID